MNYNEFTNIVNVIFDALEQEQEDTWTFEDWHDRAHEIIDGCAEVIYTATAWDLVSSIRANAFSLFVDAENALDDMGMEFDDIDKHMCALSYQILINQVMGLVEVKYYPAEAC
jgi:hypothetical protein